MRGSFSLSWRPATLLAVPLLAGMLLLSACGGGSSSPGVGAATTAPTVAATDTPVPTTAPTATTGSSGGSTASLTIDGAFGNFKFDPGTLTVKVGTKVTWTNSTSSPHTATSDAGAPASFDSGPIDASSGTFSFTFTKPGTYNYHCDFHSYMHATIVVTS